MLHFKSPRETAKLGFISEAHLRQMIARGECPGIYVGTHFRVNVDALIEKLDTESRQPKEGVQCQFYGKRTR